MSIKNDPLLHVVNGRLFDGRIQVVVPTLSTLLASSTAYVVIICELLSNKRPPLSAVSIHELYDCIVLLFNMSDLKLALTG